MSRFILAALAGAVLAAPAGAAVIDFDAARAADGRRAYIDGPWIEDGFSVSSSACDRSAGHCYTTGTPALTNLDRDGAALVNFLGNAVTTVARLDGSAFLLDGIDMANNYGNGSGLAQPTFTVEFNYFFADGTSLTETRTLDNTPGQRLTVNSLSFDLAPLTSFTFRPRSNTSGFVQFDNIRVSDVAAVPEPATWAMMIGGFGLVGGAMRRRTRTVVAA